MGAANRTEVLVEDLAELVDGRRHLKRAGEASALSCLRMLQEGGRECEPLSHLQALGQHAALALDAHVLRPLHVAVQRLPRGDSLANACDTACEPA